MGGFLLLKLWQTFWRTNIQTRELGQNNVDIFINNMGGCEVEVEGDVQSNLRATTDAEDLVCDDLLYDVHCGAGAHHSDFRLCALHSELCGHSLFGVHAFS